MCGKNKLYPVRNFWKQATYLSSNAEYFTLVHNSFDMVFLLLALYNYNGVLSPRLSLYNVCFHLTRFVFFAFCVRFLQLFRTHRAPGKEVEVPIYK